MSAIFVTGAIAAAVAAAYALVQWWRSHPPQLDVPFAFYMADFNGTAVDSMAGSFGRSWKTYLGPGSMLPYDVIVGPDGLIYFTDSGNHCIVRMSDMSGANRATLGTHGSGQLQFDQPQGLWIDKNRRIYVCDLNNHRIVRMDDFTGAGWTTWQLSATNQDFNPMFIVTDSALNIYVSDQFASPGKVYRLTSMQDINPKTLSINPAGSGLPVDTLTAPAGLFIDTANRLYVVDRTKPGKVVRVDDITGNNWTVLQYPSPPTQSLDFPQDVYVMKNGSMYISMSGDQCGIVYVTDMNGHNWTHYGTNLAPIGATKSDGSPGAFLNGPFGLWVVEAVTK